MYDAIVIGGGPAGYVATIRLLHHGLKVALIERKYLGGECTNWGCIPTKALISIAHTVSAVKDLSKAGIKFTLSEAELSRTMEWVRRVVLRSREGVKYLVSDADIYEGIAKLRSRNEVVIEERNGRKVIEGRNIVIATGTDPIGLPELRPDNEYILNNRSFFELRSIPSSILIVGGGVVGTEVGGALARLGVEVYIVEVLDRILSMCDPDVTQVITKYLRRFGVKIYVKSIVKRVEIRDGTVYARIVSDGGESKDIKVEKVLVAVGRKYNTDFINVRDLNIKLHKKGFIVVDEKLRTNVQNIYAAGDINGPPLVAHKAFRDGIIAADIIANKKEVPPREPVPEVMYTIPEVGVVGITERRAKRKGIDVEVVKYPYTALSRDYTVLERTPEGYIKLILEKGTRKVIGGVIVGNMASELIHTLALVIQKGLTLRDLANIIYPHPTYSEVLGEVAHLALKEPIHIKVGF